MIFGVRYGINMEERFLVYMVCGVRYGWGMALTWREGSECLHGLWCEVWLRYGINIEERFWAYMVFSVRYGWEMALAWRKGSEPTWSSVWGMVERWHWHEGKVPSLHGLWYEVWLRYDTYVKQKGPSLHGLRYEVWLRDGINMKERFHVYMVCGMR